MTISIDDEVEERLREEISGEKGSMGAAISEALRQWLDDRDVKMKEERALERLEDGFNMGETQYERRSELHERRKKDN
ncbi:MAG: hypothetical protein ABEJ72_06615 [Candidatus Aenigmatarchaeota archaeon]